VLLLYLGAAEPAQFVTAEAGLLLFPLSSCQTSLATETRNKNALLLKKSTI
jgi:hypothetical protein